LVLILLVLVQLPKKDAGTSIAFGGGAADTLFGAGSGNVLTKITKWSIVSFFVLVIALSYVHDHLNTGPNMDEFSKKVAQQEQLQQQTASMTAAPTPATHPAAAPTNSMKLLSTPGASAPTPK